MPTAHAHKKRSKLQEKKSSRPVVSLRSTFLLQPGSTQPASKLRRSPFWRSFGCLAPPNDTADPLQSPRCALAGPEPPVRHITVSIVGPARAARLLLCWTDGGGPRKRSRRMCRSELRGNFRLQLAGTVRAVAELRYSYSPQLLI